MCNEDSRVELDFGKALALLKDGKSVTRKGWNGPGQLLTLQVPDEHSNSPFIYIQRMRVPAQLIPWFASQTDMLATDWCEIVMEKVALPADN